MHYHDIYSGCCGLRHVDYTAYIPVKIDVGLSGINRTFTVSAPMANAFRRAHVDRDITVFELVELNGCRHTINLEYVEYIIERASK